jgi:fructose-1,6-bisphosphatase-3
MGASVGSFVCIASVLRICARYGHLSILDEGYGINLLPLGKFAMETYQNYDECFKPKNKNNLSENEVELISKMHMAISIIQFKLEGDVIRNNPDFELEDRLILDRINYENMTLHFEGKDYPLETNGFPTIDPNNPYQLTPEELDVMDRLKTVFTKSEKMQRHMSFLFTFGSIYRVYNDNLLFHACIPFKSDGTYQEVSFNGVNYEGKSLLDYLERQVRESYANKDNVDNDVDIFWYLWTGKDSPLYGRTSMKTFERYFVTDDACRKEENNDYYRLISNVEVVDLILDDFGLDNPNTKIINGHTPVKVSNGESPVKANGKVIIIDGGLSKAYHHVTGIAGYTLIYNSNGMLLAAHQPFESKIEAIKKSQDIQSNLINVYDVTQRLRVRDTDIGKKLREDICNLEKLLMAYHMGIIKEY